MENKNEELYETIPHLLYIYVRTLFCVNKYIVPKMKPIRLQNPLLPKIVCIFLATGFWLHYLCSIVDDMSRSY